MIPTFINSFQAEPYLSKFDLYLTLVNQLLRHYKMDSNWVIFKHKIKMFYKRLFSTEFSIYIICFAMLEEISERKQWFLRTTPEQPYSPSKILVLCHSLTISLIYSWKDYKCMYICFSREWRSTLIYLQYSREKNE